MRKPQEQISQSPHSPDKTMVTSPHDDNTGWILAMLHDVRDNLLALMEANDIRYAQRFDATQNAITVADSTARESILAHVGAIDRRLQVLEEHVTKLSDASDDHGSAIAGFEANIETNRVANTTLQESFGARLTAHTNFNIDTARQVSALAAGLEAYKSEMIVMVAALREQMLAAILSQKEVITAAFLAQKAAVEKAEAASEKRFEGVNEFRATLADQQRTLMPRSEVDVMVNALKEKVEANSQAILASNSAKGGLKEGWGLAIGLIGIIMTILLLVDLGSRLLK